MLRLLGLRVATGSGRVCRRFDAHPDSLPPSRWRPRLIFHPRGRRNLVRFGSYPGAHEFETDPARWRPMCATHYRAAMAATCCAGSCATPALLRQYSPCCGFACPDRLPAKLQGQSRTAALSNGRKLSGTARGRLSCCAAEKYSRRFSDAAPLRQSS